MTESQIKPPWPLGLWPITLWHPSTPCVMSSGGLNRLNDVGWTESRMKQREKKEMTLWSFLSGRKFQAPLMKKPPSPEHKQITQVNQIFAARKPPAGLDGTTTWQKWRKREEGEEGETSYLLKSAVELLPETSTGTKSTWHSNSHGRTQVVYNSVRNSRP